MDVEHSLKLVLLQMEPWERFRTALSCVFFLATLTSAAFIHYQIGLGEIQSPRFLYFSNLVLLSAFSIAISKKQLLWCFVTTFLIFEYCLGFGLAVASGTELTRVAYLPQETRNPQFEFHPLLAGLPTPNYSPFIPFNDLNGYYKHNSDSQRAI